ncbi:MAG: LLM class flavin-dependent oxidoreductase [Halioglobus sp.]
MSELQVATTAWSWRGLSDADSLCVQAEQAELMGFHSFWLPENHFGAKRSIPAPLTLLAAVAARTQHLKLGCTSYLLPIRNPILAAEEVAVLDQLSGGRLILGVGRGMQPAMFRAFAVDASQKRKLFAHNLDIMRRAWRGESLGTDDKGDPIRLSPLPVQRPEPPVWVAAFGPLALQQVAGLGLPYLASPVESIDSLEQNYTRHREQVAAAGHPPVSEVPVMRGVFVADDAAQLKSARTGLLQTLPPGIDESVIDDIALIGDRVTVRDKLIEYRERLGLTLLIVRAGVPGLSGEVQLASHTRLVEIVRSL